MKYFATRKIFRQSALRLRHRNFIIQKLIESWMEMNFEKKSSAEINYSRRWPNSAKVRHVYNFFTVSLKPVWDPDRLPAEVVATFLCGKPSPGNTDYSQHLPVALSPTVSANTDEKG